MLTEIKDKTPDTTGLDTRTNFNVKVTKIEVKIPNTTDLVTKTSFNAKFTEIENKIANVKKSQLILMMIYY